MRKIVTCSLLGNTTKPPQSIDSPMQLKLINYLGIKQYMIDKFIFRRKQSTYIIRKQNNRNILYTEQQYEPPTGYCFQTKILQTSSNSVPICKLTPIKKTNEMVIIYAHGNSSDMSNSLMFVEGLSSHIDATYVIFDYSGYGESRVADVGEEVICKDLDIVLAWVTEFVSLKNVILWGFSLGTYPIVNAASKYEFGGVILQCPIASISCIFYEELHAEMEFQEDHFSNIELINKLQSKILILHSSDDEIIPISHARILFEKYKNANGDQKISFIQVSKIGHNSLHKFIITQIPNQLQTQVFNFILEILFTTKKQSNRIEKVGLFPVKPKMFKTERPGSKINNRQSQVSNGSNLKLSDLRESKLSQNYDNTAECDEEKDYQTLQQLRMHILEADIADIEEDMKEIVIDEISGQQKTKSGFSKIPKNKCYCLASEHTH